MSQASASMETSRQRLQPLASRGVAAGYSSGQRQTTGSGGGYGAQAPQRAPAGASAAGTAVRHGVASVCVPEEGELRAQLARQSSALRVVARTRFSRDAGPGATVDTVLSGSGTDSASVDELLIAVSELMDAIGRALEGESGAFWNGQQDGNGTESLGGGWQTERVSEAPAAAITRGGLAPWQVKRVTTHIDAHLESVIPIRDLAQVAGLSVSHFMRAFRASFGHSPHRFIMRRRLERAQGLMLTSGTPLGQIALECGLADQSHLTRLFRRFVGESPGMWRRARATQRL